MISIWLNVGAMKLQYYEEIVKHSSIQLTESLPGENAEEGDVNETQSANGAESDDDEQPPPSLTSHEKILLQILIAWVIILSASSLMPISKEEKKFVVGVSVNLNLIAFYGAPLSTILTVMRTKSSSSIHFWTMIMNTTNAFFWCVYSLAISDLYILIPNGLGFLFGIMQMLLYKVYPQRGVVDGDGTELFLDEEGNSKADSRESQSEII